MTNNYLRVVRRDPAGGLRESALVFFDDRDPEATKEAIGLARLRQHEAALDARVVAYCGEVEYRRLGDKTREVLSIGGYGIDGIVGHSTPREVL